MLAGHFAGMVMGREELASGWEHDLAEAQRDLSAATDGQEATDQHGLSGLPNPWKSVLIRG